MSRKSKRLRDYCKDVDLSRKHSISEAVKAVQECPPVKFDASVEITAKLNVDPRKADQHVRGTITLPHGTGRTMRILAFASGDKLQEALENGADFIGDGETITKIMKGWTDFDVVVATPDMMREVGKLGKVLGPRGLMPTPKAGTVTTDLVKAIKELRKGKIEFKIDRHGVINNAVGKLSFQLSQLVENLRAFIGALIRAKPPGAKGQYVSGLVVSSTMGPGVRIDLKDIETL